MLIRSINGETPEGAVPVEDRGPNTEADEKSAYNNVQVGDGPQQREIGFPISTDNASWGGTTK